MIWKLPVVQPLGYGLAQEAKEANELVINFVFYDTIVNDKGLAQN